MRRNEIDHMAEILNISLTGAKKTKLVYKANLNFCLIKKRLSKLISNGLIEKRNTLYFTTEQGSNFLNLYQRLNGLVING